MLCYVYKSPKKEQTYLYIVKRGDFSQVPQVLLDKFGTPGFVMPINLDTQNKLALADITKVKEQLLERGFYLQLPPQPVNELDAFKARKKV
ncbi:YcgL domain-containing protein [Celerinatantimonas sp. YJH-8]|uniref:YcgL domain-containing protein n=1 Tax=Celerinatantimonas sp. YJH-8 TaxID=3228714 RepID=UPI0038C83AAF